MVEKELPNKRYLDTIRRKKKEDALGKGVILRNGWRGSLDDSQI